MSIVTRPTDSETKANPFIGMPFVEFAPATGSGYDPYRSLGIVDSAALQKTIETIQLIDSRSGLQVIDREEVSRLELGLQVTLFNFAPDNMQLFLGSSTKSAVTGAGVAISNELVVVQASDRFASFENFNVTSITGINPRTVDSEEVGIGQGGTFGETTGDFALEFPIKVIGDVTAITVGGVNRLANLVSGTTPAAGEIAIAVGAAANSGQLTFPSGEAPASGAAIVVTYTPSFVIGDFTENTDYVLDPFEGRIRFLSGNNKVRESEELDVDYNYTSLTRTDLSPFTQNTFTGRARVRQLTDLGVNFIWTIPSVSIRITDDDFSWSNDAFATGTLLVRILNAGGATPFGTWQHYPETP